MDKEQHEQWCRDLAELRSLQAENKIKETALEHIIEYWNKDENQGAMSDALWHILETAEQALIGEKAKEV